MANTSNGADIVKSKIKTKIRKLGNIALTYTPVGSRECIEVQQLTSSILDFFEHFIDYSAVDKISAIEKIILKDK